MFPTVHTLFRIAEHPIQINKLKIEANDIMGLDVLSLHFDKEFWGDEVEEFKPERFLEKDIKIENDESTYFMPFGLGTLNLNSLYSYYHLFV